LIATLLIVAATIVGVTEYFFIDHDIESFFVGGRSFSVLITTMGLGAQAIDSNALLGNADLAYKASFFDGAAVPIGLALSLMLNGFLLAPLINKEQVLTLPDVLARRYGPIVETVVSLASVMTLLMVVAGNLVGFAKITSYLWNTSTTVSVWVSAGSIWLVTVSGGLFSAASTSVVQGVFCWGGCILTFVYIVVQQYQSGSPPSIGFPGRYTQSQTGSSNKHWYLKFSCILSGYIYPDSFGEPICEMYDGVPCTMDPSRCCYNEKLWCPNGGPHCDRYDRGAYPWGDEAVHADQMINPEALSPFPNAIVWNWATIFVLGFGNLGALDFQARCLAGMWHLMNLILMVKSFSQLHHRIPLTLLQTARSPRAAWLSCLAAGCMVFAVAVPFAYMGAMTR
jgi:Sodium:solute symporter family